MELVEQIPKEIFTSDHTSSRKNYTEGQICVPSWDAYRKHENHE